MSPRGGSFPTHGTVAWGFVDNIRADRARERKRKSETDKENIGGLSSWGWEWREGEKERVGEKAMDKI